MREHKQCAGTFSHAGNNACRGLMTIGIALVLSLWIANLAFGAGSATDNKVNTDARWLPWIGSWRLVSDTVGRNAEGAESQLLLDIQTGDDGKSIIMKSTQDTKVLLEEKIVADGSRQPLKDNKCTGWFKYSWSDTGKRLLFESESGCPGEQTRSISGISIIDRNRGWLDVQLLRSGERQAISVRKYEWIAGNSGAVEMTIAGAVDASRFDPDTDLTVDEIIELCRKVDPGAVEAALFELGQSFRVDAKTLRRLADSDVPPQVVDLMVALSYPDKFSIQRHRITPVQRTEFENGQIYSEPSYVWLPFGYWSIYGPFSDWYWSPSFYSHYGYWGPGWDIWTGGGNSGHHGDWDRGGGRLVSGRGYSRVEPNASGSSPRYAHPRTDSGNNHAINPGTTSSSSSVSQGASSSSGSSGGSTPSSSPAASPSASPGGYHSGGSGGGTAKPRE